MDSLSRTRTRTSISGQARVTREEGGGAGIWVVVMDVPDYHDPQPCTDLRLLWNTDATGGRALRKRGRLICCRPGSLPFSWVMDEYPVQHLSFSVRHGVQYAQHGGIFGSHSRPIVKDDVWIILWIDPRVAQL